MHDSVYACNPSFVFFFQYDFSCSQELEIHSINTKGQVNDGKEYVVHIR